MAETLLDELKRYVGFAAPDEAALAALHPLAKEEFVRVAEVFYDRILAHEGARTALQNEAQVGRLKVTLVGWMDSLFKGPWDASYYELRARIGRVHVRIDLPQHYMFGAMDVLRLELQAILDRKVQDPTGHAQATAALSKILDLELAIMLHTYREDLLTRQSRIERLSTFGQLVGSIGHELRNPLSVIETSLYILRGRLGDDPRTQKHADRIGEQLGIANDIITKLLDMIRDRPLQKEEVDLTSLLKAVADGALQRGQVSIEVEAPEGLKVSGDAGQLRQVFVNLVENAIHAAQPSGTVRLRARKAQGFAEVSVEDTGPGVDPEIRKRLFEPLVTTKVKGIGLGLALVKRIVERHSGKIRYESAEPTGARFVVQLPVSGEGR